MMIKQARVDQKRKASQTGGSLFLVADGLIDD
jgi:hypothetical protein